MKEIKIDELEQIFNSSDLELNVIVTSSHCPKCDALKKDLEENKTKNLEAFDKIVFYNFINEDRQRFIKIPTLSSLKHLPSVVSIKKTQRVFVEIKEGNLSYTNYLLSI